jgi:hypothetical protein
LKKSPQRGRRQFEHTFLHPVDDEVALTFFTFFLIRTNGRTDELTENAVYRGSALPKNAVYRGSALPKKDVYGNIYNDRFYNLVL